MKKNIDKVVSELSKMTDQQLSVLSFAMPWQQGAESSSEGVIKDADGFAVANANDMGDREKYQQVLWEKFNTNPYIGTAVRGQVGRLTGFGFEITSEIWDINEAVEENEYDPRNRLFMNWSKYVGRAIIEGELFLCLTVHKDGFIETDFIDPSNIAGGGEDGVLYHPSKATLPLFYFVTPVDVTSQPEDKMLVPSINLAYYPDLFKLAKDLDGFQANLLEDSKGGTKYAKIGNFKRFIVSWDRSFVSRRNISNLRTILVWLNHYENLKQYEIDHKKSAGAYLWVITIEDPKSFRTWLSLTDAERKKTGIMAKKTPGGTLILPPGMKMEAHAPKLPAISEGDTDILHMVTGGLNEPEDISTGLSKGTFASVKASRGPMSDRMADEIAYFDRFLKFEYYRAVFFLKNKVGNFPETFSVKTAIDYDKNQKPIFKNIKKKPEFLIDVTFPVSEVIDAETRARAYLGVKHGSIYDTLGIPNKEIAKRMGFGNYPRLRLAQEVEKDRYPELAPPLDSGGQQLDQQGIDKKKQQTVPGKKLLVKKPIVK